MVILGRDVTQAPMNAIADIPVLATFVRGIQVRHSPPPKDLYVPAAGRVARVRQTVLYSDGGFDMFMWRLQSTCRSALCPRAHRSKLPYVFTGLPFSSVIM